MVWPIILPYPRAKLIFPSDTVPVGSHHNLFDNHNKRNPTVIENIISNVEAIQARFDT
jgi:hypothetical protein